MVNNYEAGMPKNSVKEETCDPKTCIKEKENSNDELALKEEIAGLREEIENETRDKAKKIAISEEKLIYLTGLDLESLDAKNLKDLNRSELEFIRGDINKTITEFQNMYRQDAYENGNVSFMLKTKLENLRYAVDLYQVKTPQEFQDMCENRSVANMLVYTEPENLRYAVDLYRIKTPQEFQDMCEQDICENENVRFVLETAEPENLRYAIDLYQVKTPQEFQNMCENENIKAVLMNVKPENLRYAIDLYQIKMPQEFQDMCENKNVRAMLVHIEPENLRYAIDLYQIKMPQEFQDMCENKNVRAMLMDAKPENLRYAVNLYQVKTPQEFQDMCENKNIRYMLNLAEPENLRYAVDLYQIKTPQEFQDICENKSVRFVLRNIKPENLNYAIINKLVNKNNLFKISYEQINYLDTSLNLSQPNEQEIEFVKKLFGQYPNAIINVLKMISENKDISIKKDEKDIFDVLDRLGNITPIIFIKYRGLDSKNKEGYLDKTKEIKQGMFKNKPIDIKNNFDEMAELIYLSYNPIGMSFSEVKKYLEELKDRTKDLKRYEFPENGYDIKIESPTDKALRENKEINFENINYITEVIKKSIEINKEEDYNKKISIALDKIAKASPNIDEDSLLHLISIIDNENIVSLAERKFNKSDINDVYSYLSETKEVLGVIFKDNFQKDLEQFLNKNPEIIKQAAATFQKEKRKNAFIKSIKKELGNSNEILDEEYWKDLNIEKISRLLSIFIEKKIIKRERGKINKELNKIEEKESGKGTSRRKKEKLNLKAYISKNVGSFFAKASAGICTADDVNLFNRPNHFHINLTEEIEKDNEIIRGNIQAYIIDDDGEKSLLLRGINPNSSFLYGVDEKNLCDKIIEIAVQFKDDNNLKAIYLSEQLEGWHALSNRDSVYKYLKKAYLKDENSKEIDFKITKGTAISKMYKVG